MEKLTSEEIAREAGGTLIRGSGKLSTTQVTFDSRNAAPGSAFFAFKGETTDGHKFLKAAYDNGARIFVVSDAEAADALPDDVDVIRTDDTLYSFQELAKWYISRFHMKKIAVTGSVGKTTTRDLIYSVLSRKFRTGTCKANMNTETGMPLMLFDFTDDMEAAVIEMGMDGPGQIRRLAEIAGPDIAVITKIGISHIERLRSRENIFKAKMEIAERLGKDSVLVINSDDDMLSTIDASKVPYRIVRAGKGENAEYRVSEIEDLGDKGVRFNLTTKAGTMPIRLSIPGAHNALNAALAAAACAEAGVDPEDIPAGLASAEVTGNRLRIDTSGSVKIIDDTYNAAPESMASAIDTLMKSEGRRKVAILGPMNELGGESADFHREVGRYAAEAGVPLLITIGERGKLISEGAEAYCGSGTRTVHFDSKEDVYPRLRELLHDGDTVLVKASRTYELEKLAAEIEKEFKWTR